MNTRKYFFSYHREIAIYHFQLLVCALFNFFFFRYHKHCFQGYSDNENECPTCFSENRKIIDIVKSQQTSREQHDTFHSQLEKASDGFALVAGKIVVFFSTDHEMMHIFLLQSILVEACLENHWKQKKFLLLD